MKILVGILIIIIFTLPSNKAIGQNIEVSRKKNSFLISGASSIMLNGMYSFDYERSVYQKGKFETLLRVGYGEWYFIDYGVFSHIFNGNSINTSINGLFGGSAHKLELNLGVRYLFLEEWDKERMNQYLPIFTIGYRYQNPFGKGLIFRAYVGDTGLGMAVGKAF